MDQIQSRTDDIEWQLRILNEIEAERRKYKNKNKIIFNFLIKGKIEFDDNNLLFLFLNKNQILRHWK